MGISYEADSGPERSGGGLTQTLAQQLRINGIEILRRRELYGIAEADVLALRACLPVLADKFEEIAEKFYAVQQQIPEIAILIGDADTLRRLHGTMQRYLRDLFRAEYDAAYVDARLRVGMVHRRIGVTPKHYIASMRTLEEILIAYISALPRLEHDCDACENRRAALHKVMQFDLHLVIDTYLLAMVAEVEAARENLQRYADSLERAVEERTRQLQEQSRRDGLTQLGNYRAFREDLHRELARAERAGEPLTLVYFDLNRFKEINDTKGHTAGDAVLQRVADCLSRVARESDLCFRLGGDEFCVILPDTLLDNAQGFCRRLTDCFDAVPHYGISLSIGLAQAAAGVGVAAEDLVRRADVSMYKAKALSREIAGHCIDSGVVLGA